MPERQPTDSQSVTRAPDLERFRATADALEELEDDETLIIGSGAPVSIIQTNTLAPRVVLAGLHVSALWERGQSCVDESNSHDSATGGQRPNHTKDRKLVRWTCVSGDPKDLALLDDVCLELFPDDELIDLARHEPFEGLPTRLCALSFGQRLRFTLTVNELIRAGDIEWPVAFSRENFGDVFAPDPVTYLESSADFTADESDWSYLSTLLNASGVADLIAVQREPAKSNSLHSGLMTIADGSDEAADRLRAAVTVDTAIETSRQIWGPRTQTSSSVQNDITKVRSDDSFAKPLENLRSRARVR